VERKFFDLMAGGQIVRDVRLFMLVSDEPADTVYIIRKTEFMPGTATPAAWAPDSSGARPGFVGRLDLASGY
jgi:hypothetical protein